MQPASTGEIIFANDVIYEILGYLSNEFILLNGCLISKQWFQVVLNCSKLAIECNDQFNSEQFFSHQFVQSIHKLKITKNCGIIYPAKLNENFQRLTRLRELDLSVWELKHNLVEAISKVSSLEKLIINCEKSRVDVIGAKLIAKLENLTYLDISKIGDVEMTYISLLQNLKTLNIREPYDSTFSMYGFQSISLLSKLTSLKISELVISEEGISYISKSNQRALTSIDFKRCILDHGVEKLGELKQLTSLQFPTSKSENKIQSISRLSKLNYLNICDISIGAEDIVYLRKLTQLTDLNISLNEIGNSGAKVIAELTHLTELNISSNQINHEGCEYISQLKQLIKLSIQSNEIDQKGAELISTLNNLTYLNISSNAIGNEGCDFICDLSQLKTLYISNIGISLEGIKPIKRLKKLTFIDMSKNKISGEEFKWLKRSNLINEKLKNLLK